MTRYWKFLLSLILFLFSLFSGFAEIIEDEVYKFSLDIPEGFELSDYSQDGLSYMFTHPNLPVSFIMKINNEGKLNSSNQVLTADLKKLSSQTEIIDFEWNNTNCSISSISVFLDQKYNGWAVSAPLSDKKSFITLITYAPESISEGSTQFMFSILNSLVTNQEYYNMPGIILSFAYPRTSPLKKKIQLNGKTINFVLDQWDEEAAQFLVDMEYSVLLLYAKHDLWKEAWQRYYRMIFRDSFGRLENFSQSVLDMIYESSAVQKSKQPELTYAQTILSWVQNFEYLRQEEKISDSDFTNLCSAVCGKGNDCDSRSLLVNILLRSAGIESFLLISPEYSHALAVAEINAPGQKYIPEGTNREFLMGETTAKVTWGMIAQDQADRSKWIPVFLP